MDATGVLTPQWLTEALRRGGHLGPHLEVSGVATETIGTGQMSDSLRIHLTYRGQPADGPESLVIKLPSSDPTSRATALSLGSYENEVRFYQELAPRLAVSTPRVYYADIEVSTASFVLLLEDMAPARPGDQLEGCSIEQARLALDELVGLHAPLWGDPTLTNLPWLHRDRESQHAFLLGLLPELWEGFTSRYQGRLGPEVIEAGSRLFSHLDAYVLADTEPWTVVHGDYRLDNLLFWPHGNRPVVVDWQTCTHGPALQDVAYFIGAGLLGETRRRVERELVAQYHERLLAEGVSGYTWERCWEDYRRFSWAGLIMAVAASMLVQRTDRGDKMFMAMAHRHARHALDLEADRLLVGQ